MAEQGGSNPHHRDRQKKRQDVSLSRSDDELIDRIGTKCVDGVMDQSGEWLRGRAIVPDDAHPIVDPCAETAAGGHQDDHGDDAAGKPFGIGGVRVRPLVQRFREEGLNEPHPRNHSDRRLEFMLLDAVVEQPEDGEMQRGRQRRKIGGATHPHEIP